MGTLIGIVITIFFVAIIFIAVALPFVGIAWLFYSPVKQQLIVWRYQYFSFQPDPEMVRTLTGLFPYYNRLNDENKERFQRRLLIFMKSKIFIPRNGLVLTERMKVLICAAAIQLTFGLSYFRLKSFYAIYIYPESYLYKNYKVKFRGHVSEFGSIHLSWNNFEKGYLFPNDGVNLGLHELMHALKVYALEHHVDFTFHDNNEVLERLVRVEMVKYKTKQIDFLKNRLVNNPDEFLAVCAECFFELPQQFRHELPEVFNSMKHLLNQDPMQPQDPVLGNYSEGSMLNPF